MTPGVLEVEVHISSRIEDGWFVMECGNHHIEYLISFLEAAKTNPNEYPIESNLSDAGIREGYCKKTGALVYREWRNQI